MAHAERRAVVESYIVRIYGRKASKPRGVRGVIEDVDTQTRRAFRSVNELFEILVGPFSSGGPVAGGRRGRAGKSDS